MNHPTVVVLHHYLDLPLDRVADIVGAPIGTVGSRLHYATGQLRLALKADAQPTTWEWRMTDSRLRPGGTRAFRSGSTRSCRDVSRIAGAVLDQVETTRQRRSWWPARRFEFMKTYATLAIAAAAVLVFDRRLQLPPGSGRSWRTGRHALAEPCTARRRSFISDGGHIELEAAGEGSNVTGSMTYDDVNGWAAASRSISRAPERPTAA